MPKVASSQLAAPLPRRSDRRRSCSTGNSEAERLGAATSAMRRKSEHLQERLHQHFCKPIEDGESLMPRRVQSAGAPSAASQTPKNKWFEGNQSATGIDFEDRKARFRANIMERQKFSYGGVSQPEVQQPARRKSTVAWLQEQHRHEDKASSDRSSHSQHGEQTPPRKPAHRSPRFYEEGWEAWDRDSSPETAMRAAGPVNRKERAGTKQNDFHDVFDLSEGDVESDAGVLLAGRDEATSTPKASDQNDSQAKAKRRPPPLQYVKPITTGELRPRSRSVEELLMTKSRDDDQFMCRLPPRQRRFSLHPASSKVKTLMLS
mmetsp:Transcript_6629/g.10476  ORF Transcript_6629/g.10476 Transcript_6629/m.10476 type:complete len:319 (+) Transcript_6629:179-1135(+)